MSEKLKQSWDGDIQNFDLESVIQTQSGVLVFPVPSSSALSIPQFLLQQKISLLGLSEAIEFCRPFIRNQFPDITKIKFSYLDELLVIGNEKEKETLYKIWLNEQSSKVGRDSIVLTPLSEIQLKPYLARKSLEAVQPFSSLISTRDEDLVEKIFS